MLNRRNAIRTAIASLASLPFIGLLMPKAEATPVPAAEPKGVKGYVLAETESKALGNGYVAETINEFERCGRELMPDATRITVMMGGMALVLVDGPGCDAALEMVDKSQLTLLAKGR